MTSSKNLRCELCGRFAKESQCDVCHAWFRTHPVFRPYTKGTSSQACLEVWLERPVSTIKQTGVVGAAVNDWLETQGQFMVNLTHRHGAAGVRHLGVDHHLTFDIFEDGSHTTSLGYRGSTIYRPEKNPHKPALREIGLIAPSVPHVTPKRQTYFVDKHGKGDCMATCLAMMLNCDIPELPLVEVKAKGREFKRQAANFFKHLNAWLRKRGLKYLEIQLNNFETYGFPSYFNICGYHIIGGTSPRGVPHAIIGKYGKPVYDPHPSDGMVSGPLVFGFLVSVD